MYFWKGSYILNKFTYFIEVFWHVEKDVISEFIIGPCQTAYTTGNQIAYLPGTQTVNTLTHMSHPTTYTEIFAEILSVFTGVQSVTVVDYNAADIMEPHYLSR